MVNSVDKYRILTAGTSYNLEDKIREYIKHGYEAQGGIAVAVTLSNDRVFSVLMVRKKRND